MTVLAELNAAEEAVRAARAELERRSEQRVRDLAERLEDARGTRDELLFDIDEVTQTIGWLRSELRALKGTERPRRTPQRSVGLLAWMFS